MWAHRRRHQNQTALRCGWPCLYLCYSSQSSPAVGRGNVHKCMFWEHCIFPLHRLNIHRVVGATKANSHLQPWPSSHRNFQVGSELKPWSRPDLPRKTCCALRERKSKLKTSFQGKCSFSCVPGDFTHRKGVDQVPAELLRQEIRNPAALHDLRKLGWVAERVWKPELKKTEKWFLDYASVTVKWLNIQRSTHVVSPLSLPQ